MSLIFALRGTSITPRFTRGNKQQRPWLAPANFLSLPAPAVLGHASVFGGSAIDLRFTNNDTHTQFYSGTRNWVRNQRIFSILYRIVPDWTGDPVQKQCFVQIGFPVAGAAFAGGVSFTQEGATLNVRGTAPFDGGALIFNLDVTPGAYTSGEATEFMVVSDGTNVYVSRDGVELGQAALIVPGSFPERYQFDDVVGSLIRVGDYPSDFYLNELLIWDTAEAHEYAPRTAFFTCPEQEGSESTDPGVANVLSPTEYIINGVPKVGTLELVCPPNVDPGEANVRDGVEYTVGGVDKEGSLDLPALNTVRLGVQFDGATKTGTLESTDPGISNVADGTAYKINNASLVGTLSLGGTVNDLRDQIDRLEAATGTLNGLNAAKEITANAIIGSEISSPLIEASVEITEI